jgi:hypothetical protein
MAVLNITKASNRAQLDTHRMCTGSAAVTCPTSAHLSAICSPGTRLFRQYTSGLAQFTHHISCPLTVCAPAAPPSRVPRPHT